MGLLFLLSISAAVLSIGMQRGNCAKIEGTESQPHSRPFMALINGTLYCGGTLIRDNWVLTAAHCEITKDATVVLGAHYSSRPEKGTQTFHIAKVVRHPNFGCGRLVHDIMLLKLHRKATLNSYVKTITLPRTFEDVRAGTQCLTLGWGTTEKGEWRSDTLREAVVIVKDRRKCGYKSVTTDMICANYGSKGTCAGDSGGPLMCGGIQRGITSYGDNQTCGKHIFPTVFTRLTRDHVAWIYSVIQQ